MSVTYEYLGGSVQGYNLFNTAGLQIASVVFKPVTITAEDAVTALTDIALTACPQLNAAATSGILGNVVACGPYTTDVGGGIVVVVGQTVVGPSTVGYVAFDLHASLVPGGGSSSSGTGTISAAAQAQIDSDQVAAVNTLLPALFLALVTIWGLKKLYHSIVEGSSNG